MTEIKDKSEVVELYNANSMTLGKVSFLENGYIINTDNSSLEVHPVLGQRQHWHIYTIENHEIIGITGLSDISLNDLMNYLEEIKICD